MVGSLSTCSIRNKNSSLVIQSCQPMNRKKKWQEFFLFDGQRGKKKIWKRADWKSGPCVKDPQGRENRGAEDEAEQ